MSKDTVDSKESIDDAQLGYEPDKESFTAIKQDGLDGLTSHTDSIEKRSLQIDVFPTGERGDWEPVAELVIKDNQRDISVNLKGRDEILEVADELHRIAHTEWPDEMG